MKRIAIIGAGIVGSATGKGFKELGYDVSFYDISDKKRSFLSSEGYNVGNSIIEVVVKSDITFVCVNAATLDNGQQDLSQIFSVIPQIIEAMEEIKRYHIVVFRSTLLPGTMREKIIRYFKEKCTRTYGIDYGILYNPEFLRQEYAIDDFLNPNRVIIGEDDNNTRVSHDLEQLYNPLTKRIIKTKYENAEMIKYVSNCFLALKISFFNEVGRICGKIGADADLVNTGVSLDKRIGNYGTISGRPFGGACLPKDTKAFSTFIRNLGISYDLLKVALEINEKEEMWQYLAEDKMIDAYSLSIKRLK